MLLDFLCIKIQYVFENMRYTIEVTRLVEDMQNILNAEYYYIKLLINVYEFCVKLHILRASG